MPLVHRRYGLFYDINFIYRDRIKPDDLDIKFLKEQNINISNTGIKVSTAGIYLFIYLIYELI